MGKNNKIYSFVLFLSFVFLNAQNPINVKKYGAKGDGKSDDYPAFVQAINDAIKQKNSEITIPYGTYFVSHALEIQYVDNTMKIKGLKDSKGKLPIIKINKYSDIISVKGQLLSQSKGEFEIENVELQGYNEAYSEKHPYIDQKKWFAGIQVQDKNKVKINNVIVKDIYGEGIIVVNSQRTDIPLGARADMVEITNCKVLDVWGFNKDDDYGDGLYVSNVVKANVSNNYIKNNTKKTKQLGRVGIVVEYMAENVSLTNNFVDEGYDRAFHLEASYGGHVVENNKFYGSDVAIIIAENYENYKDTYIKNNILSNKNFRKDESMKLLLAKDLLYYRNLIIVNTPVLKGKIHISNNKLIIDDNFKYNGAGAINSNSGSADIFSNTIEVGKEFDKIEVFIGPKVNFKYNNSLIKKNN
ncbi:right-handed parallel beta-helix repeat-containing protein [Chryseobacterium carnipullorum]|uniref:right-handed parallel beta-helix repeat-containing protein n=1 Tax=Chryseobacterium carnipullorum TaxID=1124835 RepID=UPI000E8FE2BA|nr:glycosyl hydrolase family 28-related protein [Chryseobacterium carnipullorum]HBV14169.1 hypothetical protein [Chryseobacterium carnipullorum]